MSVKSILENLISDTSDRQHTLSLTGKETKPNCLCFRVWTDIRRSCAPETLPAKAAIVSVQMRGRNQQAGRQERGRDLTAPAA